MVKITYEELYGLYITQKLGSTAISKIYNCSPTTIQNYLRKYNIAIRSASEAGKISCVQAAQTATERYGGVGFASKELNKKAKQSCQKKYGDERYINKEQAKATCLKKYGAESVFSISEFRDKAKQTLFEHYGVYSSLNTPQCRNNSRTKAAIAKEIETKRRNNSFTHSTAEENYYEYLKLYYNEDDILRQYSSDSRYPFSCDFYIKSEDLFIECNFHWTHGGHPFDIDSEEDKTILEDWKKKAKISRFYQIAIEVWTQRDVLKRQIAANNKLNYIEIY